MTLVPGSMFRVPCSCSEFGFLVQGSGFVVRGSGFVVHGSGFLVHGSECDCAGVSGFLCVELVNW
jgi:hypothetical protein